ncbi:hypothetical protein CPB84DRAFT_1132364 [Gymnopilus junonius]|uniref:Uncharacterized protein n=1 Tax=Gymnopilus junonius TaxID=109634 RepID=A0A9P5TLR3_GYMJU|nr:hypothetical protein CPB84DRAFT_1132364 [Gymnopilus junonius]
MLSSSSSSESSPSKSPSSLANFDPFAVHPFTNCSQANQGSSPPYPTNSSYGYAYAPNVSAYSRNPLQVSSQSTTNGAPNTALKTPYGHVQPGGVFVPVRKDTSSPDLDDVLKSRKTSTTGASSKPIPISSV